MYSIWLECTPAIEPTQQFGSKSHGCQITPNANRMHSNLLALRIANPSVYRSRLTINHVKNVLTIQTCTSNNLNIKHNSDTVHRDGPLGVHTSSDEWRQINCAWAQEGKFLCRALITIYLISIHFIYLSLATSYGWVQVQLQVQAQAAKPGRPVAGMEGGGKQSQKHTGKQIPPRIQITRIPTGPNAKHMHSKLLALRIANPSV